jgi:polyisoprenoid-binding protein YceI
MILMKKQIMLFLSALLLSVSAIAQTTWVEDPMHSKLGFTVTHLGIADVPGYFDDYDVTITSSKPDFSDATVELTAATKSINTQVEPRDNHLRSADFFDVEKYPTMTFKSTSIRKLKNGNYELTGDLTLHGTTKQVKVNMLYRGTTANPNANGAPVAGIQITGTIKRSDFGIGPGFPPPMISDEVRIKADGEFGQQVK